VVDWGRLVLEPYQLVPLRRIENLPFPRLLLADDTGLGKTAEAGLILFRLLQRRRADRILILCRARPEPERWQAELREKFGIETVVINDGQDYARLRRQVPSHLNLFGYISRLVMSMHFAAQRHIVDDLRRVRWDAVVIDEAHHVAERGSSTKALTELACVVAASSEALLLLTGTPHDGKGESFASLIRLLDPYAVVDPDRLDPAIVRPLLVRRLKTRVVKADGSRFLRRRIAVLDVERYRTSEERSLERELRRYTRALRLRADELEKRGQRTQAMGIAFLETFLRKRLASSVYACGISLQNRLQRVQGRPLPPEDETTPEDQSQQALDIEGRILPDEDEILQRLIALANRIPEGSEGKVRALLELLERLLADPQEKVVIFTEFMDTLEMLARVLDREGWQGEYVTYHGATPAHEREALRVRFLEDPTVRIFLATDAASEGINLQKACKRLIHLEIPWNPNRYEQRNGRIDRYGQTQPPEIYLLVATRSLEQRVAQIVVEKLERIAEQLGSVSNVFPLAARVDIDEFLAQSDPEAVEEAGQEIARRLDEAVAGEQAALARQVPEELIRGELFEAEEMAAIERELEASRALVPEYRDVEAFLRTFFRLEGGRLEETSEEGVFRVIVPRSLQGEIRRDSYERATFRRDLAVAEEDREESRRVEFLSPGHPLVQAALRRMRGKIHAPNFPSRIAYRRMPAGSPPGFVFTYALRFVDGRGETVEERFEAVFVGLDGQVSHDGLADLRWIAECRSFGHLSEAEARALLPRFQAIFETAKALAEAEVRRRQAERTRELEVLQRSIAEEALIRLGRWKQACEDRLARRAVEALVGPSPVQFDLFGQRQRDYERMVRERERRVRQFEREREQLLKQEQERRGEIRAMETVRADAVDAIGALLLIPEGMAWSL
jgi:ERCC4-related helicase